MWKRAKGRNKLSKKESRVEKCLSGQNRSLRKTLKHGTNVLRRALGGRAARLQVVWGHVACSIVINARLVVGAAELPPFTDVRDDERVVLLIMASNQPPPRSQTTAVSAEQKARGANRSTKVAGKLKVLPDQPEPQVVDKPTAIPPPPKAAEFGEGSGVTGESDDDEADDEEDTEDVAVSTTRFLDCSIFLTRTSRFTTKST